MATSCAECGVETTWDDDVGTAICTMCGTLVDPSQSILTSQVYYPDESHQFNPLWDPSSVTTLKSFRTGSNWDLAGQGKDVRDRKNTYAMQDYIRSLVSSLSASGIAPRAINLFTQAMAAGNFRWGRRAKVIAGACISVALRESKRPDLLHEIAFLLEETPLLLTRTFSTIVTLLKLTLTSAGPGIHICPLQSHLSSLLQSPQSNSELPLSLISLLKPLCLRSVAGTANSLADLLSRLDETTSLAHLPSQATSCALLLLALEAEARTSFSNISNLAQCLAARCSVGKGAVMSRYKMIQDVVAEWIKEVPWLDGYNYKNGRAKIAKRLVVARGLKDVVQFREEIWRKKLHALERPTVTLEADDVLDQRSDISFKHTPVASAVRDSVSEQGMSSALRPRKRRKTRHTLQQAALFLLDPLAGPLPLSYTPIPTSHPDSPQKLTNSPPSSRKSYAPTSPPAISNSTTAHLPLTSYLLAASPSNVTNLPTRLQLLAVERGGAGPDEVGDDELFEENEWKGILRDEEDCQKLRDVCGWNQDEDGANAEEWEVKCDAESKKGKKPGKERKLGVQVGSKKVNMHALANFLDGTDSKDDTEFFRLQQINGGDEAIESDEEHPRWPPPANLEFQGGATVVREGWHPFSPDVNSYEAGDRYDQECD